jgi:hypothetical protein
MRKVKREFFLVLIVLAVLLLNGCCCVVCPPIESGIQFAKTGVTKCELLEDFRDAITDSIRYVEPKIYNIPYLEDSENIFQNFDIRQVDAIQAFHSEYKDIPFGYIEYSNGMKVYVTAAYSNGKIQFFKVYIDGLVKLYGDSNAKKGVIY